MTSRAPSAGRRLRRAPRGACSTPSARAARPRPCRRRTPTLGTATTPHRSGSARQNARPSSSPSGRMSVVTKYVPCGTKTSKPASSSPAHRRSRLSRMSARNAVVVVVVEAEPDRDRVLERPGVHVRQELLRGLHRVDELGRRADPADLPAGERERLAARRDRDRAVAHPGQRRDRHVLTVEHEVLVDLVGDDEQVVLDRRGRRSGASSAAREHLARRVVRRVQQDQLACAA